MTKKIVICLDAAHGVDVPGKRSPDGKHREYLWSRKIVSDIDVVAKALGYETYMTTTSEKEIGLVNRRNKAESLVVKPGQTKVLLSIHNNAAGSGEKWMPARGFEIWTRKGFDGADVLAELMFKSTESWFPKIKKRYASSGEYEKDKEGKLYMTNSSKYLGLLLEWGFQDNKEDVEILSDDRYNKALADCIMDAIEAFEKLL